MTLPDLSLLVPLEVLLAEGSVSRAAERLGLSASAMSRTLARLREATGDPLLVRAGRGLVPTPRAIELREQVTRLVHAGAAVLRPTAHVDVASLSRTFRILATDGFAENFGPALAVRLGREAPHVRVQFVPKATRHAPFLREGAVDLEIGVVSETTSPELRAQAVYRDRFVGVVHARHALARGRVSRERYAAERHVHVSRRSHPRDPVHEALAAHGLARDVAMVVGGYAAALAIARASSFVATVPAHHTGALRVGMHTFPLPVELPEITVSMLWHPRVDADGAHRWFRECLRNLCTPGGARSARARPSAGRSERRAT